MNIRYTLRKYQILHYKKEINYLFKNGKSIVLYPLKLTYLLVPLSFYQVGIFSKYSHQKIDRFKVLFVVSKKNIKKSTLRNRIKRKMKESFRLQQHDLNISHEHVYLLAFAYISKNTEEDELKKIDMSVKCLIEHLNKGIKS